MRDPTRIPRILRKLETAWTAAPDLRLCQLAVCLAGPQRNDLFNVEDDKIEASLDEWIKRNRLESGWKS